MNLPSYRRTIDSAQKKLYTRLGQDRTEILYIAAPYVAGALIIAMLGLGGQWVTKKLYNRQSDQVTAGIAKAPDIDLNAPNAQELLISSYMQLTGGTNTWSNLESLAYNGVIFDDAEHHSFIASKSRNGDMSLRITNRSAETELTQKNGKLVWTPKPAPGQQLDYHVLSIAHLSKEFYNPLIEVAVSHNGHIIKMEEIIWQNMPIIAVNVQKADCISELYLYKKDLTLVQRIDHMADGTLQKYRFSSYSDIQGLRLPTMVRAENNNGETSNIRYTDIKPQIRSTRDVASQETLESSHLITASFLD